MKVELIVFPGTLDEDCERKGGVKDDPKSNVRRKELLSGEMGKTVGRFNFGDKIRHVDFEISIRHPRRDT